MSFNIEYIVEDDYYIVLDPDGAEIARGSKRDKRYVDILNHRMPGEYRIVQPDIKVGLIAALDNFGQVPPNNSPEWVSQPLVSFVALQASTVDLNNFCFDPEGDTLSFALNGSSAALPSGVTLASNGIITADGTQTSGDTTGVIIDVDDGTNAAVSSSAFSIAVVVQSGSSPALFDDLSDRAFAGEAGALAVNDNWASTIYSYTPSYAPTIPTIPQPTGDPAQPGSSQVNPNASDEYLVVDLTGFQAAMNNSTYTYVFIAKGTDLYTNTNQQEILTTAASGTSGTPRWFVWWDPDTPSNALDVKPWDLATSAQVQMPFQTRQAGSEYIYWVGLCFGKAEETWGVNRMHAAMRFYDGANNHQFYRCLEEYSGGNENADGTKSRDDYDTALASDGRGTFTSFQMFAQNQGGFDVCGDRIDFYECVFRYGCKFEKEHDQILCQGGNNHRIVSCEFSDGNNASIQLGAAWGGYGAVIEDCDFYKRRWSVTANTSSGVATLDPNGDYTNGDASCGVKLTGTSASPDTTVRLWGCRFYNNAPGSYALDDNPTSGNGWVASSPGAAAKVDIRWNIFYNFDNQVAINLLEGSTLGNTGETHSIVRNIIANINNADRALSINFDDSEMYLNTITEVSTCANVMNNYVFPNHDFDNFDMMGNFIRNAQTSGNMFNSITSSRVTSEQIGYNAYVGTYGTIYNAVYGNDYTNTSTSAMNMGDFKYYRNKLTSPVLVTISDIVPTSSTPAGFTGLVPTSGANQIGSRAGCGIDDVY